MPRLWTDADVKRLLVGYYNRMGSEADEVIMAMGGALKLPDDPAAVDAAHWERLAVNSLATTPTDQQAGVYAQLALSARLGELLGDDTGSDKLGRVIVNALCSADGASVGGCLRRLG